MDIHSRFLKFKIAKKKSNKNEENKLNNQRRVVMFEINNY